MQNDPSAPPNSSHTSTRRPDYDDEPPPYPLDEVTAIGWSPKIAKLENNELPNTPHYSMPMPIVTNGAMNNDRLTPETLPATYDCTTQSSPTTSTNVVSYIRPERNHTPRTAAPFTRLYHSPNYTQPKWGLIVTFIIIAMLGIVLVVTIAVVARKISLNHQNNFHSVNY